MNQSSQPLTTLLAVYAPTGSVLYVPHPTEGALPGQNEYHLCVSRSDSDADKPSDATAEKKRKAGKAKEQPNRQKQKKDENNDSIQIYLLPTEVDKSTRSLRSTGVRVIPDVSSLPVGLDSSLPSCLGSPHKAADVTPTLATEEGVSDFFSNPPSAPIYSSETEP